MQRSQKAVSSRECFPEKLVSIFRIEHYMGNKLVVFKFSAVTSSGEDKLLDMASLDAHFAFKLGDGSTKAALTTLLLNDLSSCRETLSAGAGDELVLLIEVEESKSDVSPGTRVMRNGIDRAELSVE